MKEIERRKKSVQKSNQSLEKETLYEKVLDEAERLDFEQASGIEGIDDEIALLRVEIKRAMSGGDVSNLKLLISASNTLERMIKTRYQISGDKRKGLKQAIYNVLRDVAIPMGIDIGADIIKNELNMK
jgi:hypothetical protein